MARNWRDVRAEAGLPERNVVTDEQEFSDITEEVRQFSIDTSGRMREVAVTLQVMTTASNLEAMIAILKLVEDLDDHVVGISVSD